MSKHEHKIKITSPFAGMGTQVWVDDFEIKGIFNVEFAHSVGDVPRMILTLAFSSVEIDGEAVVQKTGDFTHALAEIEQSGLIEKSYSGMYALTNDGFGALINLPRDKG